MDSRKKETRLLFLLTLFVISLISDWILELIRNGWSLKVFLNIPTVLLFLLFSYLLETKSELSKTVRNVLYGSYFFLVGSTMAFVVYHNNFDLKPIFLYLGFAFFGSILWGFICQILTSTN